METRIQGSVRAEAITGANVSVLAPGFTGRFVSVEPGVTTRARKLSGEIPLEAAASLSNVSIILSGAIELDSPTLVAGRALRGSKRGSPRVIVKALAAQDYALLHTDEFGRKRWLFPDRVATGSEPRAVVFTLPSESLPVVAFGKPGGDSRGPSRGKVTTTMRRLVSVVTWIASPLVKAAAQNIACAWEAEKRPYGLWQVAAGGNLTATDWRRLDGDVALLMIHGTFSTPAAGFGSFFKSKEFAALLSHYHGRILAFAHPSLSVSPESNVDWLLKQLPNNARWKGSFDVVCHSRGGLVARELAARAAVGKAPAIDRICQVAAPNLGTVLANPKRWIDFLDTHTNCLTSLPDTTATMVLEGLLCLVKIVGTGAADGLPGLVAMNPQAAWIADLARRSTGATRWYTVGTNYVPANDLAAGFIRRVADKAADLAVDAFFAAENDMVVPTAGCHDPGVPPVESLTIDDGKTTHIGYFESAKVRQALARWLS